MNENEVSIVFSFARSYFHVEWDCPHELIVFLKSIMPRKPIAELYISLGFNKHGKTELYRSLQTHLRRTDDLFDIARGECLGLVGESGCGKTTVGKVIMRALTPDAGSVTWHNGAGPVDALAMSGEALLEFRRKVQFIFQDPFGSLNPRMRVEDIIAEPLVIHGVGNSAERRETVAELLRLVGLDIRHSRRYPHSFSGGQRQRISIARSLALKPELVICDEPVSALDVSIQAQILNLLKDLQKALGLTYLFISHNLAVVDYIADQIAVMCRGRLVEIAPRERLFRNPVHPYTKCLLAAVPEPNLDNRLDFDRLAEDGASDPAAWPSPFTDDGRGSPVLRDLGSGHFVRALDGGALPDSAMESA